MTHEVLGGRDPDRMDWAQLASEVQRLSEIIDFQPDLIIGIVRGGLVPARLLSSFLGVPNMYALTVKKIEGDRRVASSIDEDLTGKAALLVEDALETGKSLIVASDYLTGKGATVKTACLYTLQETEVTPDFSLEQVSKIPTFPWE